MTVTTSRLRDVLLSPARRWDGSVVVLAFLAIATVLGVVGGVLGAVSGWPQAGRGYGAVLLAGAALAGLLAVRILRRRAALVETFAGIGLLVLADRADAWLNGGRVRLPWVATALTVWFVLHVARRVRQADPGAEGAQATQNSLPSGSTSTT